MGGADQLDTSAFESVWTNIKDKYKSEVSRQEIDKTMSWQSEIDDRKQ